ncbi:MAG: hypothetical protein C0618_00815 [Desulfuromonas sp.]|nr:MAG: hypothetical protein C0618_00815 [Desulfuromonas sp.]
MLELLAPRKFKDGLQLYNTGNYQKAAEAFSEAIKKKPNHARTCFKLGMCYYKMKMWNEAYQHIKQATELDASKSEWRVQLDHSMKMAQKKPDKKKPAQKKPNKNPDLIIQNLQQFQLKRDFVSLEKFSNFESLGTIWDDIGKSSPVRFRKILALKAEHCVAENDRSGLSNIIQQLIDNGFERSSLYYKAMHAYLSSNYQTCINLLQVYLLRSPDSTAGLYLLASAAYFNQDDDLAWCALERAAKKSKQRVVWKYLALLTKNPSQGFRLFNLWQEGVKNGMVPNFHPFATIALADGLLLADNFPLAKVIMTDALATVKSKKPSPSAYLKQTIKDAEEDYSPEWLYSFETLDRKYFDGSTERFEWALLRITKLLKTGGVEYFCARNTLLALERNEYGLAFPGDLELGVFGAAGLAAAKAAVLASGEFTPSLKRDSASLRFKHFAGITVTIYQHNIDGAVVRHRSCGIDFINKVFDVKPLEIMDSTVYVPSDTRAYLDEYFISWEDVTRDFDICLQSKNTAVVNPEVLKVRVYQRLVDALIHGNTAVEAVCVKRLRELGELDVIEQYYSEPVGSPVCDMMELYAYKPEVVLYMSGLENVGYQGNMWLPVLERLDVKVAIVIREKRIAAQLLPSPFPVFHMETMRDLELLEGVGVKTILYPANTQKNVQTLRFYNLNHFFINHGESDKVVNQSKFIMAYDKLLVAGPLAERRMRDAGLPLRDDQIVHVGRPQVELLLERIDARASRIRSVLYAPTWEGFVEEANYSSVNPFGLSMLKALSKAKNLQVYFKPHPFTGHNKKGLAGRYLVEMTEFAKAHNMTVIDGRAPIFEYMNLSDLMITDISSVLNDYLYTLKPMILTNPRGQTQEQLYSEYPSTPSTYILNDPNSVSGYLARIIQNDELFEARKEMCRESLGDFPEGSMERFNRIVTESVRGMNCLEVVESQSESATQKLAR